MKGSRRERSGSRSGLIAGLLFAILVLAAILAWQAQASMRYQRAGAEKTLRDYAMLSADEFARRAVSELGYYGFYPILTALRRDAAKGRLAAPEELQASADETLRPAAELARDTFLYDRSSRKLETRGPAPDPAARAWWLERLADGVASAPRDERYVTQHGVVAGKLSSIVFGRPAPGSDSSLVGFVADEGAFTRRFKKVVERGPLFPRSLAPETLQNDALFLQVIDPGGRQIFRSGAPKEPYLGVERPFGKDYNGILDGFVIRAAIDPAAARSLIIGGLPRSRLSFLLGLLALTAGLILTAILQLKRERALTQLRSDFVSRVSHELRTPLTQIRMFAETLILNRVRSEEERRFSLEIIDRESRRLANLVENVLRFSRYERGEDRVEILPQDIVPLVRQLLADFEPLLAGRQRLSAKLPERAMALVDEGALRQILLNLLDNAAKYGPEGREIRLEVETGPERIVVSVEDEGPGIPSRERERVWERFYRLSRDRESAVAGTGIGLAVVGDLVRLQKGRAWVEDGRGGGARFAVELPAAPPPREALG
jgi:signal transduction histidine kinase